MGDALAHPLTPRNSAPIPQTHFSLPVLKNIHSCVMQKLIKSKVLKHFALTGLSVVVKNEVVPLQGYNRGVISVEMMGRLTTVTVFETGTWQQPAWQRQCNAEGRAEAEGPW